MENVTAKNAIEAMHKTSEEFSQDNAIYGWYNWTKLNKCQI